MADLAGAGSAGGFATGRGPRDHGDGAGVRRHALHQCADRRRGDVEQPIVGRAITVTGLVFDGTRYVNAPIAVGAPRAGQGYAVTALVFDGTTYRSAPVQVGGR